MVDSQSSMQSEGKQTQHHGQPDSESKIHHEESSQSGEAGKTWEWKQVTGVGALISSPSKRVYMGVWLLSQMLG